MAPGASRSKMYFSVIASIVLMSKFYHTECASTSKSITATLDARWKHTPLLLEASEFLATESNESFWKFVDLVDKAHTFTTPSEHYQHILEVAGRILRPLGLNFLKLSLSLRYFSPRVELFNKEAHEIATGDCKSFLQLGSKLTCDLNEGVSLIKSSKELPLGWSFDFDHHYPNSESNPVTVVLYGQIGTPSFNTFHQELSLLAKSGKVHYILRHFIKDPSEGSIRLSGFGVELAVKSTEYKAVDDSKVKDESSESVQKVEEEAEDEVDGFLFGRLRKLYPDHKEQLDQFRAHLKESSNEMAPLKVWQLQDLSFQAAQRVLAAEPNRALKVLKDLSQNLPKQARSLVKTKVKEEMRKEILQNQKAFEIEPGQSALSINGLNLDIEDVNPFELLNILRAEAKTMDILSALGITGEGLSALVSMPVQSEHENYILDMRHECVTYVNDLEKDRQYWGWPQELQEILRPTFPGMLRYIAKNIFHAVFFIDPVDPKSIEIVKTAQELLHHSLPARIGVVIVAEDKDDAQSKAAVSIARAFSFIKADKSPLEAFDWLIKLYQSLSGTDAPKAGQVWDAFVASYSRDDADDVFGSDTEYDEDRKSANRLFAKTGRRSLPQVVVNGVPLKEEELDSIEEAIVTELLMQTGGIQRAVYSGALSGYPSVYEYIMRQPNVVGRLNDLVQSMERPFVDLVGSAETSGVSLDDADKFAELEKPQMVSVLCNNLRYFTKKKDELSLKPVTNWVVMDFSRKDGRNLLRAALKHVASSSNTRVGIIHNPSDETPEMLRMGRAVEAVLLSKDHVTPAMAEFLENLLDEKNDLSDIGKASETVTDILKKTEGLKSQSIEKQLQDENAFKGRVLSHQTFAKTVLNLQPGQAAVITNGRVLGPFTEDNVFIEEDFKLLEDFDMDLYARKVRDQVDEMTFPNLSSDDDTSEFRSNVMMKVSSVLISREKKSRKQIEFSDDKHSAIHITSEGAVNFDVVAVVDPLTQDAQKLAPILMVLQNVTGVNLKLFMNCREKLSEMPLKRFYRYVLEPQITFDADSGIMNPGPFAQFSDMPETPLLTMNMDTPLGWMVEAVWSPHDLDNIRLSEVEQGVSAKFDLEYIFVEGHCADSQTGQPPRGLQFTLGTRNKADMFDTIVMANLGYFQLKASPGAWKLRVREGRSAEIYEINSLVGGKYEEESGDFIVTVDSFTGKLIKVKVQRKPGMESADLLSDSNDDSGGGIWDSLSNIVGSDSNKKTEEDQTINVFSVASGHLYERFLRIMMLSVLKHTKSPIKFWFLKNFLSPTLKSLLPHMARQYGFEYELVQYHWPHWLHAQTEKQRVIWGYKILFLDVLFPLHVKRIIFVDADLIVRTDLKELHDMDLGGAPYAYTPFCDSRTEMEGFRFWKQGYWRSHLGGRPYHISALYVVDLKKFRRMAAGDRLRGQYQGLSQDPNSLSNLDQDLPNNMIHQVPIKSLPQEWLWCATWCDEASKVYAKTIDLCNNPMTKEPKLDSAVRIVKEWPDYDNEVRRFQEKIKAEPSVTKPPENLPLPIKEEL